MISDELRRRILPHLICALFGTTLILVAEIGVIYTRSIVLGEEYIVVYGPGLLIVFLESFALWMVAMEGMAFLCNFILSALNSGIKEEL